MTDEYERVLGMLVYIIAELRFSALATDSLLDLDMDFGWAIASFTGFNH